MEIKHEHIAATLQAWKVKTKPEEIARLIAVEEHTINPGSTRLYDPEERGSRDKNRQRLFRTPGGWIYGETAYQRKNLMSLLPAIENALKNSQNARLLAYMQSFSSEPMHELTQRAKRLESEIEAIFGAIISMIDRHQGSGPAGGNLFH